jgi:CheY-like chemotaxis protein
MLQHPFALAILDVQMPSMNGFELAELMRGTERTRGIPIVFVTAAGKELNYAFRATRPAPSTSSTSRSTWTRCAARSTSSSSCTASARKCCQVQRKKGQEQLELQARRACSMRDDFMSMVAHELRNAAQHAVPAGAAAQDAAGPRQHRPIFDAAYLQKMVARDERQIRSMVRLIDDMLDVSRIRTGRLSIRPSEVDLAARCSAWSNLANQAARPAVSITLEAGQPITGTWRRVPHRTGGGQPADQRPALRQGQTGHGHRVTPAGPKARCASPCATRAWASRRTRAHLRAVRAHRGRDGSVPAAWGWACSSPAADRGHGGRTTCKGAGPAGPSPCAAPPGENGA